MWHYFIINFKCSGFLFQHETLRSRFYIRIHYIFCYGVYISFVHRKFQLIVFIYFITFCYIIQLLCYLATLCSVLNLCIKGSLYSFNYFIILAILFCLILNLWRFLYFRYSVFVIFLQLLYYFVQNCTWKHEYVSGSKGLSEFCNYCIAFHVLLNLVLIILKWVYFRFSNFIILLKLIIHKYSVYVVVLSVNCFWVWGYWIDIYEMFILYRHWSETCTWWISVKWY
jgi:hypothetical protein